MKIFVTGDKGFIGTNLTRNFQNKEIVMVTDYQNNQKKRINILERDQFQYIESVDAIIHLAAKTSITNSFNNPYETYHTNIGGTLNLLDFARERKIKKIINISTYVYGKPTYLPIDEEHPINPHTPYNKSKIISENLCKYYSHDYGINIVTLRPFYIYGPLSNPLSFIPSIIQQINKNGNVYLNQENTKRDFLFIDDFINLVLKILNKFPEGYNVYNAGYGKSNSLEEIIKIIEKITGIKINILYDKSIRPNDIIEMVADITRVTKSFDWKPQIDIEEGLRLTLKNFTIPIF
ncbi:MAG: NAD-dependent epimerase/dehydratase family protein [Candidatus Nitrosocosmicus sp.]